MVQLLDTKCFRGYLWQGIVVDLIAIKLQDFDVILGMDFLGKYNAKIDCRKRCVTFNHYEEE